jgi:hypothetical protein
MIRFEKKTALVTGASSGIGKAFAESLAARGANLILVASSEDKLRTLASQVKKQFKANVEIIVADLSDNKAPSKVFSAVQKAGQVADVLISNAGFGTRGQFHTLPADQEQKEIMVNVAAVVQLTHLFLPSMVMKKEGLVINVSSTAAFQPVPFMAVYGATKAFVLSFSEALWAEYRKQGIRILALCPGETDTFEAMGTEERIFGRMQSSGSVVETALRALEHGRSYAIDGKANYLMANLIRFAPRSTVAKMTAKVMRPKRL